MSLLMQALASAEKEKQEKQPISDDEKRHLALTPVDDGTDFQKTNQASAANVFTASQLPAQSFANIMWLLLLVAIALMVWFGVQFYENQTPINTANYAPLNKPLEAPTISAENVTASAPTQTEVLAFNNALAPAPTTNPSKAETSNSTALPSSPTKPTADFVKAETSPQKNNRESNPPVTTNVDARPVTSAATSQEAKYEATAQPSTKTNTAANVNLTVQKASVGVDPTLMLAYEALQRGDFTQAQQQYRQVLKLDQRNIDALLGMATIAQKQSRDVDAIGWYQKALELEPNNPIALSAMLSTQADSVSKESHLKNLIAAQPEVASFHAELGNLYAAQNQWQQAQAAYFNACRFAPSNADYVFNLAISLDQLGQKSVALTQYQRALDLVQQTGATSPNQPTLEARIQALKP